MVLDLLLLQNFDCDFLSRWLVSPLFYFAKSTFTLCFTLLKSEQDYLPTMNLPIILTSFESA